MILKPAVVSRFTVILAVILGLFLYSLAHAASLNKLNQVMKGVTIFGTGVCSLNSEAVLVKKDDPSRVAKAECVFGIKTGTPGTYVVIVDDQGQPLSAWFVDKEFKVHNLWIWGDDI